MYAVRDTYGVKPLFYKKTDNCIEFTSCTEGNTEIAISYWPNKESIRAWKNNPEHQQAQELGKSKWYKSYQVQIVEVLNQYESNT